MKLYKYLYIGVLSTCIWCFSSCELAKDIDDFEPLFSLPAETAIVDELSAELALVGAYAGFRQRSSGSGLPQLFMVASKFSGLAINSPFGTDPEDLGFVSNQPVSTGASTTLGMYTRMYDLINRSNWIIEKVAELEANIFTNPGRREEIVAEAKGLRALGHFYLLRLYGQFYDTNSAFGLNIRTSPVRNAEASPRNTVAETYAQIIQDLDDAIAEAPDLTERIFINKTFRQSTQSQSIPISGRFCTGCHTIQRSIG